MHQEPEITHENQSHVSSKTQDNTDTQLTSGSVAGRVEGTTRASAPRVIRNEPYTDILVRDEGQHALHIAGAFCDPRIEAGYRYRLFRGELPDSVAPLRALFPGGGEQGECVLTQLRPCNAPGSSYVFKVRGEDHIYTDRQIYPAGVVLFEHALSRGDSFKVILNGERCGVLRIESVELSQPVIEPSRRVTRIELPQLSLAFEKTSHVENGRSLVESSAAYRIRTHQVQARVGFSPELASQLGVAESENLRLNVITSTRDGSPLICVVTGMRETLSDGAKEGLGALVGIPSVQGLAQGAGGDPSRFEFIGRP
jgi:hypothetical protein